MILTSHTPAHKRVLADGVMRAAGYKLIEPADLPSKPKPAEDHAVAVREKWSTQKRLAFTTLEPVALALLATDGPVSVVLHEQGKPAVRMGHNRGVWPAKIVRSSSWRDTVTQNHDKNPFMFLGTQARIWVDSELAARTAQERLTNRLAEMDADHAELSHTLRHDFKALNPEIDLALFELEMHDIVRRATNGNVWDDDGLSVYLDKIVERSKPRPVSPGRRGA